MGVVVVVVVVGSPVVAGGGGVTGGVTGGGLAGGGVTGGGVTGGVAPVVSLGVTGGGVTGGVTVFDAVLLANGDSPVSGVVASEPQPNVRASTETELRSGINERVIDVRIAMTCSSAARIPKGSVRSNEDIHLPCRSARLGRERDARRAASNARHQQYQLALATKRSMSLRSNALYVARVYHGIDN